MTDLEEWKAILTKFKIPFEERVLSLEHYNRADTRIDITVPERATQVQVQGYPGFTMSLDFSPDDGSFDSMKIWE